MSENTQKVLFTFVKAVLSALVVAVSSLVGAKFGDSTVAILGASVGTSIAVS